MRNNRWIPVVAALLLAVMVGAVAYNIGVAQGSDGTGTPYQGWHGHGHGPWGFGFFFGPLFFILFWLVIVRGLFGGRGGWRHGRGCGDFEEWHRQAHERMWNDPSKEGGAQRG